MVIGETETLFGCVKSASCAPKIGATSKRGVLTVLQTFPSVWHNVRFHAIRVQTVSSTDRRYRFLFIRLGGVGPSHNVFWCQGCGGSNFPSIDNLFERKNHEKCAGARKVAHFCSIKSSMDGGKTRKVRRNHEKCTT